MEKISRQEQLLIIALLWNVETSYGSDIIAKPCRLK